MDHVIGQFKKKLDNLEATKVRDEFKLSVATRNLLPSMRFLLTIHDLTSTSLNKLDSTWTKYLEISTGLPRPATTVILHLKSGLGIPKISDIYYEVHTISHVTTRFKGDDQVNRVLDEK